MAIRTSRIRMPAALLVLCTLLVGCRSNPFYQGYSADALVLDNSKDNLITQVVTVPTGGEAMIDKTCFSKDAGDACTAQRNRMVSTLIIASEYECLEHRRSIYGREATWNITLGTMTNLFAGAASVVTYQKHRPIFAALALASNSERSLVNETVYKQMLTTAVDKKIMEMREQKMVAMHSSLKLPMSGYSASEALRDVVLFHSTCSFMTGLQKALEEGTQTSDEARIAKARASRITRLEATLATLNLQYKLTEDKKSPGATKLEERIRAVSDELKAEETTGLQKALDEGTRTLEAARAAKARESRIARLDATLATLNQQYKLTEDKKSPGATKLEERIKAVSDELKAEETAKTP